MSSRSPRWWAVRRFLARFAYSFRRAFLVMDPSRAAMPGEVIDGFLFVSAAERSSREVLPSDTVRTLRDLVVTVSVG